MWPRATLALWKEERTNAIVGGRSVAHLSRGQRSREYRRSDRRKLDVGAHSRRDEEQSLPGRQRHCATGIDMGRSELKRVEADARKRCIERDDRPARGRFNGKRFGAGGSSCVAV